jgi:hypothetical protein
LPPFSCSRIVHPAPRGRKSSTFIFKAALIGFLGVLHTWGQSIQHHPHVHFWFRAAGSRRMERAGSPAGQDTFFRSQMFRGLFLHYLGKAFAAGELNFVTAHRHLHEPAAFRRYLVPVWNTECQRGFLGPYFLPCRSAKRAL